MKKFVLIAIPIMVMILVTFSSCSKKGPEAVAEKFLTYTSKGEFEKASELGTLQTKQFLAMAAAFSEFDTEGEMPNQNFTNLRCEVDGDAAECTYEVEGELEYLNLVKEDGKWLVNLEK